MANSLSALSQHYLELNDIQSAIETIEYSTRTRSEGKRTKSSTSSTQNYATLLLCGLKSNNMRIISQNTKLLMNQFAGFSTLNTFLKDMNFKSKVPNLLNVLSIKQKVEVKKRCKKCSRCKCRHYKSEKNEHSNSKFWLNQSPPWRLFKNSVLVGYFAKNFN